MSNMQETAGHTQGETKGEIIFNTQLEHYLTQANNAVLAHLPPATARPQALHSAMRYSVEAGGKRLRPIFVLATADALTQTSTQAPNANPNSNSNNDNINIKGESKLAPHPAAAAAAATEYLHTYSLVHDDLPCMDNSPLRRGKPTCHVQFNQATALLAGDALLTHAFATLATNYTHNPALATALVSTLATAAGSAQLIGGQMEDLQSQGSSITQNSADTLQYIQQNKTAALLTACLHMGAHTAFAGNNTLGSNTHTTTLQQLTQLGHHIGMAFQIIDDCLDAEQSTEALGKQAGLDAANATLTYPAVHGLQAAHTAANTHTQQALETLKSLPGNTTFLSALVAHLLNRTF